MFVSGIIVLILKWNVSYESRNLHINSHLEGGDVIFILLLLLFLLLILPIKKYPSFLAR